MAVNKAEAARSNPGVAAAVAEAGRLGFGEGVGISAETGEGMAELYAALAPTLDRAAARLLLLQEEDLEAGRGEEEEAEREEGGERRKGGGPMRVAIVGAPNAGKSTLSNALLGSERSLTGPEPGLTRDAVWATLEWTPPQEKRREEEGESGGGGRRRGGGSIVLVLVFSLFLFFSALLSSPEAPDRRAHRHGRLGQAHREDGLDRQKERRQGRQRRPRGRRPRRERIQSLDGSDNGSLLACFFCRPLSPPPPRLPRRCSPRRTSLPRPCARRSAGSTWRTSPSSSSTSPPRRRVRIPRRRRRRQRHRGKEATRRRYRERGGGGGGTTTTTTAPLRRSCSRTELALASRAAEAGRAVVFVGAKADLLLPLPETAAAAAAPPPSTKSPAVAAAARALALDVSRRLPQLAGAPVLALSAVTGAGLPGLLPAVAGAHAAWDGRVPTSALNRWLERARAAAGRPRARRRGARPGQGALPRRGLVPPAVVRGVRARGDAQGGGGGGGGGGGEGRRGRRAKGSRGGRLVEGRGSQGAAARAADERLEKMLSNRIRSEFGMRGVPIRVAVRGPSPASGVGGLEGGGGGGKKTDYRRRS